MSRTANTLSIKYGGTSQHSRIRNGGLINAQQRKAAKKIKDYQPPHGRDELLARHDRFTTEPKEK